MSEPIEREIIQAKQTITINDIATNRPLFTIKPDGSIEKGPGFTTNDEMSKRFWDAVENTRMQFPSNHIRNEALEEAACAVIYFCGDTIIADEIRKLKTTVK